MLPTQVVIFQAFQRFFQGHNRVFEMFFPQIQAGLRSSQNFFFTSWMIIVLTPILGCLHSPKGFRFLTSTWCFSSCCLTHLSVVTRQFFPFFSFNSFVNCWQKACQAASTSGGPHLSNSMCFVLMKALCVPTSSARNVNSSVPYLMVASGNASLNCGFLSGSDLAPCRKSPVSTAV